MLNTLDQPSAAPRAGASGANDTIRAFVASDARSVADLLMRAFQNSTKPAPAGMVDYLREVYLDAPWFDPEIASRVMVQADGTIIGFVGVSALPMDLDGQPIRTAVISSLAVDPHISNPMVGARLLRDVRNGPQDAMVSDRSNAAAVSLLHSLKGHTFPSYSLDWVRSLRPAGLAVETLASRWGAFRLLKPLAALIDRAVPDEPADGEHRWATPTISRAAESFTDGPVALGELAGLVRLFIDGFPLKPRWSAADLELILGHARGKRTIGEFTARVVNARNGTPVGLFLYHLTPGRIANILQILTRNGQEGVVIDRAIAHAKAAGAVAIRGRATPNLLEALSARRAVFLPDLTTTVFSHNPEILRHFREGTAFFTGLAGENWMRLNGDTF